MKKSRRTTRAEYLYRAFNAQLDADDERAILLYLPSVNVERDPILSTLNGVGRVQYARHDYTNRLWRAFQHGVEAGKKLGQQSRGEPNEKQTKNHE